MMMPGHVTANRNWHFARTLRASQRSKYRLAVVAALALLLFTNAVMAQQSSTDSLLASCVACHGEDGNSPNAEWPDLAGQKSGYLQIQLRAYRDGSRINAVMSPFAQNLSDPDIKAIAEFYAQQPPQPAVIEDEERVATGQNLAAVCIACHGMQGVTANPEWPNLAAQQTTYMENRLKYFRAADPYVPLMSMIVADYSDEEFTALAAYFAQLGADAN